MFVFRALKLNALASLCLLKRKFTQNLEFGILTRLNLNANFVTTQLTLNPLTWKIWWAPNNASRWQMGFNSAFKGFNKLTLHQQNIIFHSQCNVLIATITSIVTVLNLACSFSCRYVLRRISINSSNCAERSDNERLFSVTIQRFI